MHSVIQPAEIALLVPLAVAQIGIVNLVWRFLRTRISRSGAVLFWGAVLVIAAWGCTGICLGVEREFAPRFRGVRTTAFLWLLPSSLAFVFYVSSRFIANRFPPRPVSESRRKLIHAAAISAMAAPFAVEGWGAFVTRVEFKVEEVDFPIAGLHSDLAGLRILQISDVHLSQFLSEREFARVIDASNELRPHVAVMTGDLISGWGDPIDACIAQLSRIRADAPLLGCLGNHEIYAEVERYTELQAARRGMTFLRTGRKALQFGDGVLNVAGIDYQPFPLRGQYLRHAAGLIDLTATNLLLSHNPDVFIEAPEQGWQAILGGHTHGGQVTMEILKQSVNPARFLTPYVSGLYVERGAACYVTRGIGTVGIPARVGATPEITLLKLRTA